MRERSAAHRLAFSLLWVLMSFHNKTIGPLMWRNRTGGNAMSFSPLMIPRTNRMNRRESIMTPKIAESLGQLNYKR